jgi:hypothetical protein
MIKKKSKEIKHIITTNFTSLSLDKINVNIMNYSLQILFLDTYIRNCYYQNEKYDLTSSIFSYINKLLLINITIITIIDGTTILH